MTIGGTVQWRVPGTAPRAFKCDRAAFVDFIKRKSIFIEWLIVDVCLTRWYFDGFNWYNTPRYRYVPDRALVPLNYEEMARKLKLSPNGFTQF